MRTGGRIGRSNSLLLVMIAMSFANRFAIGQAIAALPEESGSSAAQSTWQYGGCIDAGYLHDFTYPANHLFRSRGTTFHVNEADLNMTAVYLKKQASESSRWGTEVTLQAGKDSEVFGYSATTPNLEGSKWLRHLGPTDVSYLAPIRKGLTTQAGIFSSFIGYDSLYAKDNFNYTRPWGADFTPYLMLWVNAQYPLTPKLTGTMFVISGYWHLAHANNVPSSGGQLAYKPSERVSAKQTVLYGPHQSETSLQFWRFLSDSIVEWKRDPATRRVRVPGFRGKSCHSWKSARLVDVGAVADALDIR